jgi:hypothetical protein
VFHRQAAKLGDPEKLAPAVAGHGCEVGEGARRDSDRDRRMKGSKERRHRGLERSG